MADDDIDDDNITSETGEEAQAPTSEEGEEVEEVELKDTDIIFDCPHCAKSLAIDYRGAGLQINCTDCGEPVEVPIPTGMDISDLDGTPEDQEARIMNLRRMLSREEQRVRDLEGMVTGLKERRSALERARAQTLHRFAEVRSACEIIQRNQLELSTAIGKILDVISQES